MTLATCTRAYACIMPKEGYLYMPVSMALAMCTMGCHGLGNVQHAQGDYLGMLACSLHRLTPYFGQISWCLFAKFCS